MEIIAVILILLIVDLVQGSNGKHKYRSCGNDLRVRKEIHDLSQAELSRFLRAVCLFLHKRKSTDGQRVEHTEAYEARLSHTIENLKRFKMEVLLDPNARSLTHGQALRQVEKMTAVVMAIQAGMDKRFSAYVDFYSKSLKAIQNSPTYLHWHRVFLFELETELRRYDANVTLPYWAWSYEAYDARSSSVFSDKMLGSHYLQLPNEDQSSSYGSDELWPGSNIKTGLFADLKSELPVPDYVARGYLADEPLKFHGRNCFKALENRSTNWLTLSETLEYFSRAFKYAIGGTMASLVWAPADPLFLLHHTYIDCEWDKWQNMPGNPDAYSYYGPPGSPTARLSDSLPGFDDLGINIASSIDNSDFCVQYAHPVKIPRKYLKMRADTSGRAGTSFPKRLPSDFMLGLSIGMSINDTESFRQSMRQFDNICQGTPTYN